jgi:hypothetical protein
VTAASRLGPSVTSGRTTHDPITSDATLDPELVESP